MGLDLVHILSPDRHHTEFECVACNRLTSLNSYIATACSHPICKSCCSGPGQREECPLCKTRVGLLLNLNEAQPLAYRVLCRVKVACPLRKRHDCTWAGDYNTLQKHIDSHRHIDRHRSKRKGLLREKSWRDNSCRNIPCTTSHDEKIHAKLSDAVMKSGKKEIRAGLGSDVSRSVQSFESGCITGVTKKNELANNEECNAHERNSHHLHIPMYDHHRFPGASNDKVEERANIGQSIPTIASKSDKSQQISPLASPRGINNMSMESFEHIGLNTYCSMDSFEGAANEAAPVKKRQLDIDIISVSSRTLSCSPISSISSGEERGMLMHQAQTIDREDVEQTESHNHDSGKHIKNVIGLTRSLSAQKLRHIDSSTSRFADAVVGDGKPLPAKSFERGRPRHPKKIVDRNGTTTAKSLTARFFQSMSDIDFDIQSTNTPVDKMKPGRTLQQDRIQIDETAVNNAGGGRRRSLTRTLSARFRRATSDPDGDNPNTANHTSTTDRKYVKELKKKASHAFREGRYLEAVSLCTQAIDRIEATQIPNGDSEFASSIYANRAAANHQLRLFSECIDDSDKAMRLDCTNAKAYLRKSRAQVELGQFENACTSLAAGLKRAPQSSELQCEIAFTNALFQTMTDVRQYQNEEKYLHVITATNSLKSHRSNKYVLLARANAYLSLDDTTKAAEEATLVFSSDGENTEALELRAKAQYLNAQLEDALMDCQTALVINSEIASTESMYQTVRKVRQLFADAERSNQNGTYAQAAHKYGMAISAAGSLSKSSELYRVLHLAMAEAHRHDANYVQALINANLVLDSQRTYIAAWKTRIRALKAMNRLEQLADELAVIMEGDNNWGIEHGFLVDVYDTTLHLLDDRRSKPVVPDYYAILGIDSDASMDDICMAYRLKVEGCNLDKSLAATNAERADTEHRLRLLQQCMDVLSDIDSRRIYDLR